MTALPFEQQPHGGGDPLLPGAAPATIRAALFSEDQAAFDTAYESALTRARDVSDLDELSSTLEQWRRLAVLQRDPMRFASVARRAAERISGERTPDDEPLADTRRRAGI